MKWLVKYLDWLQLDNPTGKVEKYPELDNSNETSLRGVFIAGDLTGVPLLKLAGQSGTDLVKNFALDKKLGQDRKNKADNVVDIAIIGAGPAGISAAMECEKQGFQYRLLEAGALLNTISNYPAGKPILIKPEYDGNQDKTSSNLKLVDGTKESLLEDLKTQIAESKISVEEGVKVEVIRDNKKFLELETNTEIFRALRVILAIGKSGNPRKLDIPGSELPKTLSRLIDPGEYAGKQIMVVGGGDSAVEASIALSNHGAKVTHCYRGAELSRPKEKNINDFNNKVREQKIKSRFGSSPIKITDHSVILKSSEGEEELDNDLIFTLIGNELPTDFLARSGIRLEGHRDWSFWVFLTAMVSFFTMLYFGKKGNAYQLISPDSGTWDLITSYLTAPYGIASKYQMTGGGFFSDLLAIFKAPFVGGGKAYGLKGHKLWLNPSSFLIGWSASIIFIISGVTTLAIMGKRAKKYFTTPWGVIKYTYLIFAAIIFFWIYLRSTYTHSASWVNDPTQWYSLLYCTTMALFALRRAWVKRTRYIYLQMTSLVLIQIVFLYILPFGKLGDHFIFDLIITKNLDPQGWLMTDVFPIGRWTSFWFILIWPLSIDALGTTTFWTWFPFVQLIALFALIHRYGKGAYCGWICSCGGMAETLGDEYRTLSPHGPKAKRLDNIGQGVLAFAIIATLVHFMSSKGIIFSTESLFANTLWGVYLLTVDIIFAGVLGLGVYFFLGGRVWCRFGCPLAALMHIMTRFSRYRIVSEKKKCISCNICTKVCHMGIDVMGFANKGIPMNDVECVRCSTCITSCPMDVLAFATTPKTDTQNINRQSLPDYNKNDWRAGIR